MDLLITNYKQSDSEWIAKLFHELQIHENRYDTDKTTDLNQARLYRDELLTTVKEKAGEMLVARLEDKVVGLISWYLEKEIEYELPFAYISDIVVTSEARGKGIGKKLMEEAIKNVKKTGTKRIHIGVMLKNEVAKRLYNELGFVDYSVEMVKRI